MRKRVVSRSIKQNVAICSCVNVSTGEVVEKQFMLSMSIKTDLNSVRKHVETSEEKVVFIKEIKEVITLMEMDEDFFIKNARVVTK